MADLRETLRQIAEHASRYAINLDGQVCKEEGCTIRRGGYAIVYSGILRPRGTRIAIKAACGSPASDEDAIRRVLHEAHLWSKLRHENIVPVLGISTEFDLTVSIVSPWMEKGDAHLYVQNTNIDPCPLMIDIARGLQYLHTRPGGAVFHGDLKGANVLISNSGRALLVDFGFSHLVNSTFSMPVSGRTACTMFWAAPETLDGGEKSAAADIWSLGMTVLELFTRKRPFHPFNQRTAACNVFLGRTPNRPSDEETCWRLTDTWWDICIACWKSEPALRPTIVHVLQAITDI